MPLFETFSEAGVWAVIVGPWNAPPHRYFIACRCSQDFVHALGLSVIDEFATFSSPILLGPVPLLGKIYDLGITLGHRRDAEMNIDTGWPPLCIGLADGSVPAPAGWEERLLGRIKAGEADPQPDWKLRMIDRFKVQRWETAGVAVVATDAPLLPKQLRRVCEAIPSGFSVAFSVGNRIQRRPDGAPLAVEVASERLLESVLNSLKD